MKRLHLIPALLGLLVVSMSSPADAGRCSGGAYCTACSNCSACKHCSQNGGSCSVCRPDLYGGGSSSTSSSSNTPLGDSSTYTTRSWSPPPEPITQAELEQRAYEEQRHQREQERRQRLLNAKTEAALQREARRQALLQSQREAAARPASNASTYQNPESTSPQSTSNFVGKCVGVSDGDTISVMHNGRAEKIRLYGIDSPESAQPFGAKAKHFTSNAVFGKEVKIYSTGTDRYNRTLGWVFEGKECLNRNLVEAGLAWHYKQYSPRETKLAALEMEARKAGKGLWSDCCAVAPWDWRRGKRAEPSQVNSATSTRGASIVSETQNTSPNTAPTSGWQVLIPVGFMALIGFILFRPRKS